MSKRWLIALLLISFSFNLAVIGSIVYLRITMPCPYPPPLSAHGRMMPPSPEKGFFGNDEKVKQLRNKFDETRTVLMKELAKDPVNEARINEIIDSSLVAQNDLERTLGAKIIAFRKTMTAEEAREHFLRRAEIMKHRSHDFRRIKHRRKP